ncbi:protein bassoon isoform 3-T3 [Hipposideros larvatus]
MGNEASLEGGAGDGPLPPGAPVPGPGPGAGKPPSAPAGGGQLPAAGAARAPAGPPGPGPGPGPSPSPGSGPGPGPGPVPGSLSRRLDPKEPLGSQRAASPTPKQAPTTAPGHESPRETRAQGPAGQEADGPRRTLQVDSRTQRSGRSPSVSPDRGSTPTSPYSVPQIAPLPSSTLCPICKTSDLTSAPNQPNFNTCTQCHNKVCNQCGFNPNPHLTQVKEWLCLNCQMQRALGMDMTTAPRSKSQQQLHSPALSPAHSPAKQPLGKPEQERSRGPGGPQSGPRQAETARATSVPGPAQAAAPPEVGRVSPQPSHPVKPSTAEPRPPVGETLAKSATTVPSGPGAAEQTQEGLTGKLFGLGASLLTQASTLMSVQPEAEAQGQPAPSKGPPKIVFSDASKEAGPRPPGSGPGPGPAPGAKTEPAARTGPGPGPGALARTAGTTSPKHGRAEHQAVSKATAKPKTMPKERATCPLCQAELNVGSKGPANYNTCTTCKLQVCNLCGFNPTPHLVEKTEWLCLNCQTKRLLEGSLGEPTPLPLPTSQQPPVGAPQRAAGTAPLKQKGPQGLGQPSGPLPAKASPLPTKASPQAKPLRASEPSRTPSSAQEKKTGVPAKAEPMPKPPPETTLPPGTPKAKTGVRRTEPATPVIKAVPEAPKGGEAEELVGKPYSQDLSRSPQSLSDTGYSSDGVSSSQSEITGVVQQEMEQLDSAGVTGPRPPSPSQLHKVGSSMRPSLQAQGLAPSGEQSRPPCSSSAEEQRRRPHSLSIMPEAFDSDEELEDILEEEEDSLEWGRRREQQDTAESSDDFGSQLRHDYVEDSSEGGLSPLPPQPPARAAEMTDEEFMRRQILEMSAEEDNLEEDDMATPRHGLARHGTQKGGARPRPEPSQDPAALPKRRLPHNATTGYEELLSEGGPAEATDGTGALQGGLRRFKTIELNSTGSYGHELDLGQGPDPSLDREPELEMESLTGSPEDRSRGEHSSTLPASTPSYTSGTSPTSLSSLEEDSDSSPSRRQRLEEAKQQRKARHRSHGPLLPTIEDSSEEEELREEEELLREQEKMREVEQQRIRSTARKTRRDKEELRAQRRRERSKTPPSNLSPIEDASPTEELRQAAEMEELHRSSCSEYSPSPSLDSEAEALDGGPSRLYKSGSEYSLPTFMSLYSPTETPLGGSTTPSSGRPLKSAEEAYEEMMRKAELLQRQQGQAAGGRGPHGGPSQPIGPRGQGSFEYQDPSDHDYGRAAQPASEGMPAGLGVAVYEEILQTSQSIARMRQASSRDLAFAEDKKKEKQFLNAESAYVDPMKQNGGPLTPGTSPTQLAAPVSFSPSTSTSSDSSGGRVIPDVRVTQHFAKEPQDPLKLHSSPASPSSASKEVGTHAFLSTSTTVSITMASSVLMAQQKQPVVYGDPFQSRLDFGQGAGSPVCLAQVKQVEQAVQTAPYQGGPRGRPREAKFARYNLPNQVAPLARRDVLITQMGSVQSVSLKSGPVPEPGAEPHRAAPAELRSHALPGARKPHTVLVQVGEGTAGTMTTLLPEEPAGALDLTGMRPESQLACCDMVYKFPFGSSCTGTFHPAPSAPEKSVVDVAPPGQSSGPFYNPRDPEPPEPPTYRAQGVVGPGPHEEQRPCPQGLPGRLYSSMSDTNLAEAGLNYHAHRMAQLFQGPGRDSAVDLSSLKQSYSLGFADGRYLGQGLQYGSFTDLRHPTDLLTHPLPMRRYSSVSNIYSDHRYGPRGDAAGFQEASLAQYSATTAREISRMCAALNSMDQYGGRHGSGGGGGPDLMQYQPQPRPGLSAPQGLTPLRPGLLGNPTFPEGHPSPGTLAQYRPTAAQGAAIRQLLPSTATVRAADGMIYSTINTPIAATLPITTQPGSVLRPMVRGGLYRPYVSGGVTAVPLTSLTRMPMIAPRVPLGPTGLYRYPAPSGFPTASSIPPAEGPLYLGKPAAAKAPGAGGPPRPELPAGVAREEPLSTVTPAAAKEAGAAPATLAGQKPPVDAAPGGGSGALSRPGLDKEEASQEERQRKQQEQLLQLERERVELEKLRQLRLQEELERERVELQRHREEEQLLVQRELQELQTIKHHVLQQQQEERQAQFALQREQLVQQRLQLEQIQQLQQQLQQQLEEQKQRQKAPFPVVCEGPGRGPPPAATELAQNGQYWPPLTHAAFIAVAGPEGPGQPREPVLHRGLPSSASDMSLQTEEQWEASRSGLKKRHSMPRLRDVCEPEMAPETCVVRRIADTSVQTDDEDGEGRYFLTRRRRARRSADCSVQTDDEDSAEWEQPVRRRRSRLSRHSDSGSDSKHDATASSSTAVTSVRTMSSVAIQTISDCSVQTEPDQLPRVSPAIHITAATDPKVEIIRYISAPEKTGRGESLACQTEPDGQAQGVAGPQLIGPTAISPYLPGIQIVTPGPLGRFEKKKPDPLEIGYQAHLPVESLSQLVSRQPPKSPQVLYSPVSPLSPHRLLDASFASSERLNKAHVSPQKHFTADSALRQQTLPRPMKTLQRSLSDPKPLSPTAEESAKDRFSLYQHQGGLGSQVSALPPNGLVRKVKRTLPSPPPEEAHLPLAGQAPPQLYAASLLQRGLAGPTAVPATKASLLRELDRDLRLVEHESTKLRKKQAELDEEEKEIDAKLKYLELGITQRKESLAKDRGGRDYPPLRGLGEHRDYLSDSELNQLRLQGCATPAGPYADFPVTATAPATHSGPTAFQQPRFPPPAPQYTAGSGGPTPNGFPAHQAPTYPGPSTYPAPAFPPGTSYPAEPGLASQQAFRPTGHYAAQTPMPTTQGTLFPVPPDNRALHQKPRQTSLADLEQKVPTNYEVIASPVVAMSSAPSETSYSGPVVSSSYEQGKAPELSRASDRSSVSLSPAPTYPSDSHYTSLEQNVPRNYVMIDDISELTKDSTSTAPDSQRLEPLGPSSSGRPGKEPGEPGVLEGPALPCCYTRGEEESEEDSYDPRGKSSHHRSVESDSRPASAHYYSDSDYRHGARAEKYGPGPMGPKHPSKSLAPAAISSKRSKHRKQGMEQKISKFSPIEEAKDVESDLASYPSPAVSSGLASRGRKFQDEITYGLKKNVYEQQRYYGVSSRDQVEEDDRMYSGSSRSRVAAAYSGEKLSSHDFGGRGKAYEREREAVERLQKAGPKPSSLSMAHGRARPPMRSQASEEESPVSPLGRPRPAGGTIPPGDTCPQFCSSHSMPDVQEHVKDGPRAHTYKREEGYILDDSHCVVSDSEAYHLGQEETDWFDKPRDARSDRFRHHGGHVVSSSSQKRGPARHSYHDYDEPPEEGLWPHDEGGPSRHTSAKEHRHHGDHGRHSGRHAGEETGRRAAKPHVRDQGRHEARPHPQPSSAPAMQKKGQPGYPSPAEYSQPSRAPSAYHHASDSKKGSRQAHSGPTALQPKPEPQPQPQSQGRQGPPGPQQSQPPPSRQTPSATSLRQPQMQQQQQQQQQQPPGHGLQHPQQTPAQARLQQQGQPTARGPAPAASQPAGKPQPGPTTATGPQPAGPPRAEQANGSKGAAKAPQQGKPPQAQPPPGPGPAGMKAGARPGGTPGAPASQPGAEGESVLSKILPGGAAEQAGKLTEAVSAFGKKFSSFW